MPFLIRRLPALLLCTHLLGLAASVGASEPAIKTSPAKPALLKDALPGRESTPGDMARLPKAPPPSADPMDRLRARLSEKLGSRVEPDSNGDLVKVVARNPEAPVEARRKGGAAGGVRHAAAVRPAGAWSYDGATGPEQWAQLRPEFAQCGSGSRQSPIDIRDGIAVDLDPIAFDYKSTPFSVLDTGRTVQVDVAPGNFIEVMGRRYLLDRIEFRHPAEERINGRQFDLGAHLIHKDAEGRTAIVAVLMDRGADQPVVQSFWNNLPLEKGERLAARAGVDLTGLLPVDRRYFTYMGSMTTPPCQEGVLWMVMKSPVAVSSAQLAVISRLYPMNARPPQAIAGRMIKGPQ